MTGFAGTGQPTKLAFRRDGVILLCSVFGIVAMLATTARELKVLYPTAARRSRWQRAAGSGRENPGAAVHVGGLNGTSVGAFVAAQTPAVLAVLEALRNPAFSTVVAVNAESGTLAWLGGLDPAPEPRYEQACSQPLIRA